MSEDTKVCFRCKYPRELSLYATNPATPDGLSFNCAYCRRAEQAEAKQPRRSAGGSTTSGAGGSHKAKPAKAEWLNLKADPALLDCGPDENGKARTLVINTYAGSLLIAAKRAGVGVIASLEDVAYGTQLQAENFPELKGRLVGARANWPDLDLSRSMVIAHPPCAAFSMQQTSNAAANRGVDAEKFKCTKDVMEYSLSHRAAVLMLESVPLALEGARATHDEFAERHGYDVYRILQNASTFGVAQNRSRFWVVFVRRDAGLRPWLTKPEWPPVSIGDVMDQTTEEELADMVGQPARKLALLRSKFIEAGLTEAQADEVIRGDHGPGRSWKHAARILGLKIEKQTCKDLGRFFGRYEAQQTCVLDPAQPAPVVMWNSQWVCRGRGLCVAEYKAVMGFPRDYKMPRHERGGADDPRPWLSRGVVPQVAEWLLRHAQAWMAGAERPEGAIPLEAGQVYDFKPRKAEAPRAFDPHLIKRPKRVPADARAELDEKEPKPARPRKAREELTAKDWARLEASGMAWELYPDGPPAQFAEPAKHKRRVELAYRLTFPVDVDPDVVAAAFAPHKQVVVPPLKTLEVIDARTLRVVAQYEPPNAGGHKGDVDRIIARVVRALTPEYGEIKTERA